MNAEPNTEQTPSPVIAGLVSHISEIENRALQMKRVVNSLNKERGEPPMYRDEELTVSEVGGSLTIKKDQFYRQKIHTAMRQYLVMRKAAGLGPATLAEIYKAVCEGGMEFETENEENRKTNMRSLLRKNTSIFHRLPDKVHFGLADWYGVKEDDSEEAPKKTAKKAKRSKSKSQKSSGVNSKAARVESTETKGNKNKPDANDVSHKKLVTQEQAVREALNSIDGNFKRQEVIDWIIEHHPEVHASEKRSSIFAMLSKLGDEIETVTKAKGAEPATYRKKATVKS
jgi:hypothetical protein